MEKEDEVRAGRCRCRPVSPLSAPALLSAALSPSVVSSAENSACL